jgi:hypothetical protein
MKYSVTLAVNLGELQFIIAIISNTKSLILNKREKDDRVCIRQNEEGYI